jgi:hypothetical protein
MELRFRLRSGLPLEAVEGVIAKLDDLRYFRVLAKEIDAVVRADVERTLEKGDIHWEALKRSTLEKREKGKDKPLDRTGRFVQLLLATHAELELQEDAKGYFLSVRYADEKWARALHFIGAQDLLYGGVSGRKGRSRVPARKLSLSPEARSHIESLLNRGADIEKIWLAGG